MLRAVIFDLDGVLVDSEKLWRDVEIAVFGTLGVPLDDERCRETTGLRVDEVVAYWNARFPWRTGDLASVGDAIVAEMLARIPTAPGIPGAVEAVECCAAEGLRLAVASSSPEPLITAALDGLGVAPLIEIVHSAMEEELGKPHPAVYLTAAANLGVPPVECVAVEDSLNGVIAAKAARMACIAVPERWAPAYAVADVILTGMKEFRPSLLNALEVQSGS